MSQCDWPPTRPLSTSSLFQLFGATVARCNQRCCLLHLGFVPLLVAGVVGQPHQVPEAFTVGLSADHDHVLHLLRNASVFDLPFGRLAGRHVHSPEILAPIIRSTCWWPEEFFVGHRTAVLRVPPRQHLARFRGEKLNGPRKYWGWAPRPPCCAACRVHGLRQSNQRRRVGDTVACKEPTVLLADEEQGVRGAPLICKVRQNVVLEYW